LAAFGGSLNLWDLTFTFNRAIGGFASVAGKTAGGGYGGGVYLNSTATWAGLLTVQSNLAQGGAGLNGATGGVAFGGGLRGSGNSLMTIGDSTITLNNAQGGFTAGGANGVGYGGGIATLNQLGVLQLPNTIVDPNFASTGDPDIHEE
jgi:hypothetical protein